MKVSIVQDFNGFINSISEASVAIENHFDAEVIFFDASISPIFFKPFRDFIETIVEKTTNNKKEKLAFFLKTTGGQAEMAERMVDLVRQYYKSVIFIVPDYAYSAGTILCMSGDEIHMDYQSSLGPTDPQVLMPEMNEFVPSLGYIDKVNNIVQKQNLSEGDVVLLKSIDLARLAKFEQARDLAIELVTEWLVKYKFKNWDIHRTLNIGQKVTLEEKRQRAKEIAKQLSDHNKWLSHGRSINIEKLKNMRIEINDYSNDNQLRKTIRIFNDNLTQYKQITDKMYLFYNRHI